MQKTAIL